MSEATQALLSISQEDRQIQLNNKKLAKIPPKKEILRKPLNIIEQRLNNLKGREDKIKGQVVLRNKLIEVEKAKLAVSNEKMTAVSNQKEYSALQKEIDAAGRVIKHTEDQILELDESVEPIKTEVAEEQELFNAEEKEFKEKAKDITALETELNDAITKSQNNKAKLTPLISADLKGKYEKLTSHNIIPAALEISTPSCVGCAMSIRFQVFNDIIRDTMGECPTCGRMLFYKAPEPVEEPEPKKKTRAKKATKAKEPKATKAKVTKPKTTKAKATKAAATKED